MLGGFGDSCLAFTSSMYAIRIVIVEILRDGQPTHFCRYQCGDKYKPNETTNLTVDDFVVQPTFSLAFALWRIEQLKRTARDFVQVIRHAFEAFGLRRDYLESTVFLKLR